MAPHAWVTGAAILTQVGNAAPSADDTAWADACAAAVNSGVDARLGIVFADLPEEAEGEVAPAALVAATEAYKRREAPFGVTGYVDLSGSAVRVARDWLAAVQPQLDRWADISLRFR